MNSPIEPLNLNEVMNGENVFPSIMTTPDIRLQIERTISSQNAIERTTAPFVTVRNRRFVSIRNNRQSEIEQNIFDNSPQLRQLYFQNQLLRSNLREIMNDANNTRNRMINVSIEYNALLRQLIEQVKEEEKKKLKIVSRVKAKKELYSKMETHCGICLEHHEYTDVCTLPCNHEYGTKCFETWYTRGTRTCPECRNPTKEIKTYRLRAEKKVKTNISSANVCSRNVSSPSPDDLPLPDVLSPSSLVLSPSPDVLPFPDL